MKTTRNHFNLSAILLLASLASAHAQSWVNVYHPTLGGIAGICGDIGTDAAGNVFAVGRQIAPDGTSEALVQASSDQGATWSVLDRYAEPGLSYAHLRAFAADPITGHLLAGGNLNNLLPNGTYEFDTLWFLREWDPATGVWSIAEDNVDVINDVGETSCADILVTSAGDVYTTGGGAMGWVVRKRSAGTAAFSTVDADYSGRSTGGGWDMSFHPSYGVFSVGTVNGIWTVRRSSTGNLGTWTTVDSFYVSREWTSGTPFCMFAGASKIHVVGAAYNATTRKTHWVVRSSADGGATWSITDNVKPAGANGQAMAITEDASGNLIVGGSLTGTAGDQHWIVRKGTPGTTLVKQGKKWVQVATTIWTTIDDYQLVQGKTAQPNAIVKDAGGNIFAGGRAQDAAGVDHWIVRKLPAAP